VQETQNLASSFQTFQQNFGITQSASFIGKTVTAQVTDSNGNEPPWVWRRL